MRISVGPQLAVVLLFAACGDTTEDPEGQTDVGEEADAAQGDTTEDAGADDVEADAGDDDAGDDDAARDTAADSAETDTTSTDASDATVEPDATADTTADVVEDATADVVEDTTVDASADTSEDTSTDASDDTSEDADAGEVPRALPACEGPGGVIVVPSGEAVVDVEWAAGDLVLRGYAPACGADAPVQQLRLRSTCGGAFDVTLSPRDGVSTLDVSVTVADVVDAAGAAVAWSGTTAAGAPAATTLDVHTEAVSGDAFEMLIDVSCAAGDATAWSLVIDTPSTAPTPAADNGWGVDLAPSVSFSELGCEVGDTLPNLGAFLDQYGNSDVMLGQFAGDMLVIEIGGMWCAPCLDLAPDLGELGRDMDTNSAFGFTFIAAVADDASYQTTDRYDLEGWANQIEAEDPVLGGAVALDLESLCRVSAFPTTLVVDPDFVVREVLTGPLVEDVRSSVTSAWGAFSAENPEWSSPRCDGLSEPGDLCGCVDDRTAPDGDEDGVPDACDACGDADDRITYGDPARPQYCYVPIAESPRPVVRGSVDFQAAYDPINEEVRGVGDSQAVARLQLRHAEGYICNITRTATGPIPTVESLGTIATPLVAWTLSGDNSTVEHTCSGELDDAWPSNLTAAINATTWGVTITNRCGLEGCAGADDPLWTAFDGVEEPEDCDLLWQTCPSAFIGASVYFGSIGSVEGPAGEALDLATMAWLDEDFNVEEDDDPDTFREWVPAQEVLAGPPRVGFAVQIEMSLELLVAALIGAP